MPLHSAFPDPQNVTGSVALSEVASVLVTSGSVTGLLVGGQPVSATNVIPVSISGTFSVGAVDAADGALSASIPVTASLNGYRDPGGLLQPGNVDHFGNQIVTGSIFVTNFPASQFVKQDSTPWIISGNVSITGPITGSVSITAPVAVTQGTSPWIISGSNWIPTITGSVRVENRVDVRDLSTSASVTFVTASAAASVTLAAALAARSGLTVYNDSSKILYLKLGVSASLNDYSTQLAKDDYFEVPFGYTGRVDAISAAGVAGVIRITELV